MKEYLFQLPLKTRDYECDIQGVVNNANYQHYLEVTRHEFIESIGLTFQSLHDQGIDVMVSKITINYRASLRGGEEFISCLNLHRQGVRFIFDQDIYRKSDNQLCIRAQVECVSVVDGTLSRGEELAQKLGEHINQE